MKTFTVSLGDIRKHPKMRLDPNYWSSQKSDKPYDCKISATFDRDETVYNSLSFTVKDMDMELAKEKARQQLLDFCKKNNIKGYVEVTLEVKRETYQYEKTRQTLWPDSDYSMWFER